VSKFLCLLYSIANDIKSAWLKVEIHPNRFLWTLTLHDHDIVLCSLKTIQICKTSHKCLETKFYWIFVWNPTNHLFFFQFWVEPKKICIRNSENVYYKSVSKVSNSSIDTEKLVSIGIYIYRSRPFQQAKICEDWSFGTGALRKRKTAYNMDDSVL
jgi:hypothetical protein